MRIRNGIVTTLHAYSTEYNKPLVPRCAQGFVVFSATHYSQERPNHG